MGAIDSVTDSWNRSFALLKKNAQPLFRDFVKIIGLEIATLLVGLILILLIAYLAMGMQMFSLLAIMGMLSSTTGLIALVLIAIVMVVFFLLLEAITSVQYNAVDNSANGKQTAIMAMFYKNLIPVALVNLVMWILGAIILAIFVILYLATYSLGTLAICGVWIVGAIVLILFGLCMQYITMEAVLGNKGTISAINSSISIAVKNLGGLILLDIVVGLLAVSVFYSSRVIETALSFLSFIFGYPGTILYTICWVIVALFIGIIIRVITIPMIYYFWKGAKR